MRLILTILLFIPFYSSATKYYVGNTGNDANTGTSPGTAWGTLHKVNSFTFAHNDSIFFKRGDSFYGSITVSADDLYFGVYGKGNKPVITGFRNIIMSSVGGNIWSAVVNSSSLNMVLINGSIAHKARYPNTGYLSFTSYSGKTQISGGLTGTPNYTGAEVVVRDAHYIIDINTITSQVGGTLNLSPGLTYIPRYGGNGYFIQNTPTVLDTTGEWIFSGNTLKVYSTTLPAVQASTTDTLVYLNHRYFVTFDNIEFQGANLNAFKIDSSNHITIKNCSINYSGRFAIYGILSSYISILKDSIQNTLSNGVYLGYTASSIVKCPDALIDGNYIKNTGILEGMALGYFNRGCAIDIDGDTSIITNNVIINTGYIPIHFAGKKSLVKKNFINHFAFVLDDGGGIYCGIGGYTANYNDNSIIRSNIITNGIGAPYGTSDGLSGSSAAPGIYLDDHSRRITVDSNSVSDCLYAGINLHNTHSITIRWNSIFTNTGNGLAITGVDSTESDFDIKHNIILVQNPIYFNIHDRYLSLVNVIDSNYYQGRGFSIHGISYSLTDWATIKEQDRHSVLQSINVSARSVPLFLYNPNQTDTIISLPVPYRDVFNVVYKKSITLHPFTSVILFKFQYKS